MLNTRIKELRTARNLSQVQMAKLLGVTKQSDVTGLSIKHVAHIPQVVDDMRGEH